MNDKDNNSVDQAIAETLAKREIPPMQAVIFDFNGTLFLDNDKHVKAWDVMSRELRGKGMSEAELHEHCNGMPNHMIVRYLLGGKSDPEREQTYSVRKEALYRQLCKEDVQRFHLIDGAEKLFDHLKEKGIPFTIASASIKDNIDFFVESFHLDRWIAPENICYDNGKYDDKTHMLLEAARILGKKPEEITVIEDSRSGVNSAVKAGIQDIRIINSAGTPERFAPIPEVRQIVEDMNGIKC